MTWRWYFTHCRMMKAAERDEPAQRGQRGLHVVVLDARRGNTEVEADHQEQHRDRRPKILNSSGTEPATAGIPRNSLSKVLITTRTFG